MYSSQSPGFLNGINTPSAVTAIFTAVSNLLGMSINNAFGRLWPANAPARLKGIGTSTQHLVRDQMLYLKSSAEILLNQPAVEPQVLEVVEP
jgi:hypothetical protein